ncbi:MAG: HAD family hydrolase [Candidatus Dojkabacteria bacterium]|nr:HAD family hydrolase [Candidatus Dojkabacteria bacterium]MDQ7021272.1 HAD family hydrolase [Candidatus Dojkabacteria bacterium]
MKYKLIAFDLDDTLNDGTKPWRVAYEWLYEEWFQKYHTDKDLFDHAFNKTRAGLKEKQPEKYMLAIRALHLSEMVNELEYEIDWFWIEKISKQYWEIFLENVNPREGLYETLNELKNRGYKLVVATDFSFDIQLGKLNSLMVTKYFSYIYTAEEIGSLKKTCEMFEYILKHEHIKPSEMLMIGDNVKGDIIAPKELGIDTCLIRNKFYEYSEDEMNEATYRIEGLVDLLKII